MRAQCRSLGAREVFPCVIERLRDARAIENERGWNRAV